MRRVNTKDFMRNIAFISLGCDKNRVDTENIIFNVLRGDYAVSALEDADVIVINTCAFIESARKESIDTILETAETYKTHGKCQKLIVTGCLPQKYASELKVELPEVDAFIGTNEYDGVLNVINSLFAEKAGEYDTGGRVLTTSPSSVFLRIADGCNNKCTFCTIPSIRGGYRSVPLDKLIQEASSLVDDGASELILIAQDVTRYGYDLGEGAPKLIDLLKALCELDVKWIRLMYCYPEMMTDELINYIKSSPKIAKYIDIPIQHISSRILKLMNRRGSGDDIKVLFDKLSGIVIRTTLMVGFPSEEESDFDELIDFVNEYKPVYAGVFAYSKEEDTPSAKLKPQITAKIKKQRVNALGAACTKVTKDFNASQVGRTIEVLYEDIDFERELFKGRAEFQSPDIDGCVYFTATECVEVGRYYKVKITDYDDYDLYGEVV